MPDEPSSFIACCNFTSRHINASLGTIDYKALHLDLMGQEYRAPAIPAGTAFRIKLPNDRGISQEDRPAFQKKVEQRFRHMLFKLIRESGRKIDFLTIGTIGPIRTSQFTRDAGMQKSETEAEDYGEQLPDNVFPAWEGLNFYKLAQKVFKRVGMPDTQVRIRPDAGLIALGEYWHRQNQGLLKAPNIHDLDSKAIAHDSVLAYVKISREINAGFAHGHRVWRGTRHPQAAMMHPQLVPGDDFEGACEYHRTCIGGMIGIRAIEQRLKKDFGEKQRPLKDIHPDHRIWDILTTYIAQMCVNIMGTITPTVIVLGGRTLNDLSKENKQVVFQKIMDRVSEYVGPAYAAIDIPELYRSDGYVQSEISSFSGVFGGLIFAAKRVIERSK